MRSSSQSQDELNCDALGVLSRWAGESREVELWNRAGLSRRWKREKKKGRAGAFEWVRQSFLGFAHSAASIAGKSKEPLLPQHT